MEDYKSRILKAYLTSRGGQSGVPTMQCMRQRYAVFAHYYGRFLPGSTETRILDVGCGYGALVSWMQSVGYRRSQGIDISPEQVSAGRSLGVQGLEQGDFIAYLRASEGNYGLITAIDVIEHLSRQQFFEVACLVRRRLCPDGRLLIQVPNGPGFHCADYFFGDITHEMAYSEKSVEQIARAAGFSGVKVYPVNPYPKGISGRVRAAFWWYKSHSIRFWKLVEFGSGSGISTANIIAELYV